MVEGTQGMFLWEFLGFLQDICVCFSRDLWGMGSMDLFLESIAGEVNLSPTHGYINVYRDMW